MKQATLDNMTDEAKAKRIQKRIRTIFSKYNDTDTAVYTREEWEASPKHDYGKQSLVVATYEGPINHILNGYVADNKVSLYSKLEDMLEEYGYYFEFCNHWSFAVYPK